MKPRARARKYARRAYEQLPPDLQVKARKAARTVRARAGRSTGPALLSVVMPVYNVESYLAEAVESVLTQSYATLELILVDDGSSDTSGSMCDDFAAHDKRVRVIHKTNAGLGAARNTGIDAARGEYICFIDSDDYVLPDAYADLMRSLRLSGSDVATGNVRRRAGKRMYQAWNQSLTHLVDRRGVTLDTVPELIYDTVAWNKIFRLDFWNAHVRTFPVGKLYEDMLPMFTSFVHARSIDILARPVYVWRLRDEGNSITQRMLEPRNIGDRVEMLDAITQMMEEHHLRDELRPLLYRKVAEGDLWIYVRAMSGAQGEAADTITEAVRRYWSPAPESVKARLAPERRLQYWMVEHGLGKEVGLFQQWYASIAANPPMHHRNGRALLDVATCPVVLDGVSDDDLDMAAAALPVAMLTGLHWHGTQLTVEGYAYIRFVSAGEQQVTLRAVDPHTGKSVEWVAQRTASVSAGRDALDTNDDHLNDGFRVQFDAAELAPAPAGGTRSATFVVHVSDTLPGGVAVERETDLTRFQHSSGAKIAGGTTLPGGGAAYVLTDSGEPLTLVLDNTAVTATHFGTDAEVVTIGFAPGVGVDRVRLSKVGARMVVPLTRDSGAGTYSARLPASARATTDTWRLQAQVGNDLRNVVPPAGFAAGVTPNANGLRADANQLGRAVVRVHAATALVTELECGDDGAIVLRGSTFGLAEFSVGLAPEESTPTAWHQVRIDDGRFEVRIPTEVGDFVGIVRPLPTATYEIHGIGGAAPTGEPDALVVMADTVGVDLPLVHVREHIKVRFERAPQGRIRVKVNGPVGDELLGKFAQARMLAQATGPDRVLEDAVFSSVDLGSNACDSALAIHHELRRRGAPLVSYWGVEDLSVAVPEGGVPVVKRSAQWYEKINSSRYVVNNYGGILGLDKHPDQRYLQTWHGTPLKYIGVSEVRHKNAPNSRLDAIAVESSEWDAVVSPSPYLTALVPSEFLFHGQILETGYPRNDRLATASEDERLTLRRMFGLPDEAKVLLYAPTYRERNRHGWRAAMFDGLDLGRLVSLLGPEWYVLLRGHSFVARDDHADRSAQRIVDVTRHGDINDLYLAADVLVTDYSSVMFDFAVTRKPMAFFTPDLETYVAARGTYFDLAQHAPGPMYEDVAALAKGLGDLAEVTGEHADKYTAFAQKFVPWDDGGAAARVVDAFFDLP